MKFVVAASDPWHEVRADDAIVYCPAPVAYRLLTPPQWQAVRSSWPGELPVGLVVPNDVDVETVGGDAARFALIALEFPKWVDGRAYSQARLLRSRFRYTGEIRATGEVLVDMLPLLARTGFDAVVLRADQSREVAQRTLARFADGDYQGNTLDRQPRFRRAPENAT